MVDIEPVGTESDKESPYWLFRVSAGKYLETGCSASRSSSLPWEPRPKTPTSDGKPFRQLIRECGA